MGVLPLPLGLAAAAAAPQWWDPAPPLRSGAACTPPTPLSPDAPNVLLIGDSISMGGSGYSLFVQDMLTNGSGGTLVGSLQHGGGFGGGGQMASSANGAAKVAACMGNATGDLKPKAWSVITYNAGLHDCDTNERVEPTQYAANLKAIFETLKPAAAAVAFVTTTPYDMPEPIPHPAGINMSCVVQYNVIARQVAAEVGAVVIDDLYGYVEDFCQAFPKEPAGSGFGGNYTTCAIQTTGLHFFNHAPMPSGQQYTGLSVADAVIRLIPQDAIRNRSAAAAPPPLSVETGSCGAPPAALSGAVPNVLIIGDSISMPGSGYGPGVEGVLMRPRPGQNDAYQTGPLAAVQHSGGSGSNQAGPTTNGAACINGWVGDGKWDVITINFGIHDCNPGGDGRTPGAIVSKTDYVKNLGAIYDAASAALAPGGRIVWVSTTPASTGTTIGNPPITAAAFNTCVDDYNVAALALLGAKPDVIVADLHAAVLGVCGKGYASCNLQLWDNVHFTEAGKQFCAVVVAKAVAPLLGPKWAALTNTSSAAAGAQ